MSTFPVLPGLDPSPNSTVVGGLCTTSTSSTTSYRVLVEIRVDPDTILASDRRRNQLLDILKQTIHQLCVFHKDGDGLPGLKRICGLHEFIVQSGFVDSLGQLSNQFSDPFEHHCQLCMVLPDLFTLLVQLLRHGGHLRVEVCVFRLELVELLLRLVKLFPIRHVSQLSEDVFGAAVVQGLVHSPGDVLQLVVLQLEVVQVRINPLEGVFWKRPRR